VSAIPIKQTSDENQPIIKNIFPSSKPNSFLELETSLSVVSQHHVKQKTVLCISSQPGDVPETAAHYDDSRIWPLR